MESIFQTDAWSSFKKMAGWVPDRYSGLLGLSRKLPLRRKILYFPEIPYNQTSLNLAKEIKRTKEFRKYFTIRFEFLQKWDEAKAKELKKIGLKKSFEAIQPEYRQWVYLDKSEEEIVSQMKELGRRNLRKAQGENLTIKSGSDDSFITELHRLYNLTGKRADFVTRDLSYFRSLMTILGDKAEIILVGKDGINYAGALITYFNGMASYLYGGTDTTGDTHSAYLMHFEVIRHAKEKGCRIYDLIAIAPFDKPNHPYKGITFFKTQFGGESVRLLGSWDLVKSRLWYTIYSLVERRRRHL